MSEFTQSDHYWHTDTCFVDLFPWCSPYNVQPDPQHKSFALAALDIIYDVLGGETDSIRFLAIRSIGNRMKVGLAGSGFDIYNTNIDNAVSVLLRVELTKLEKQSAQNLPEAPAALPSAGPDVRVTEVIGSRSLSALETLYITADSDSKSRLQKLFNRVFSESDPKPLAFAPDACAIDEIAEHFPNFSELCAYLKAQFTLARMGDHVFRLQPILLVSEPGVGKTEILRRISKAVATEFKSFSMATAQSGSYLSGSDIHWSNSRQGQLFEMLIFGAVANPIIMLDELDKVSQRAEQSPIGALYELLERETARDFEDRALPGVRIDASHVIWVATANDASMIESAMLSRFRVFKIPSPTRLQMPTVIQSVFSDMLERESWGASFNPIISDEAMSELVDLTPRDIRMLLDDACASAAMDGRSYLSKDDFHSKSRGKARIGFSR